MRSRLPHVALGVFGGGAGTYSPHGLAQHQRHVRMPRIEIDAPSVLRVDRPCGGADSTALFSRICNEGDGLALTGIAPIWPTEVFLVKFHAKCGPLPAPT